MLSCKCEMFWKLLEYKALVGNISNQMHTQAMNLRNIGKIMGLNTSHILKYHFVLRIKVGRVSAFQPSGPRRVRNFNSYLGVGCMPSVCVTYCIVLKEALLPADPRAGSRIFVAPCNPLLAVPAPISDLLEFWKPLCSILVSWPLILNIVPLIIMHW